MFNYFYIVIAKIPKDKTLMFNYAAGVISDNGVSLSGGEAQKIAIARTFYKDCPFAILDEPSANLDPVAEYSLNHSMTKAADDKTVIFISHRLSTTVMADEIYMLENGEIIEKGSHEELMALDGKYAYMFRLQAEKYNAVCESNTQTANAECKMQSAK
mgnify:CR=1 FL=1